MTRAEKRIEAAKRRKRAAEHALSKEYERQLAERAALTRKQSPRIWAARRKASDARVAVAVAELAALGITPMKTIVLWHPKYTGITAKKRYVVRVTRDGEKRLVPVGKTGAILKGRYDQDGPYGNAWSNVTVTDEELKE